jgi:hypothetical protein
MHFASRTIGMCGVLLVAAAAAGCTGQPRATPETSGASTRVTASSAASSVATDVGSSGDVSDRSAASVPTLVTYPDGWSDIELTASASEVHPGDSVDVSIVCPHRGRKWAAPFEVAHPDLTFAMEEVRASASDRYTTSFVMPYWLEPGDLELHGGCPVPPGPCDDTDDCPEYRTVPTPVVTLPLPLAPAGDGAWDAWRPVVEPYLDPTPEAGTALPGGAMATMSEPSQVSADVRVGDRLPVITQCPLDAATDGARFVIVPARTLALVADRADDWGWSVQPDPNLPGRYIVSSDTLLLAERVQGEPLPWFVEVPPLAVTPGDSTVAVVGEIPFDAGAVAADDGNGEALHITALCEDVGMPFDPRSIDFESTQFPIEIRLSE